MIEKLSTRVERLEGPDRDIDCLIGVAVGWFVTEPNKGWPDRMDYIDIRGGTKSYPGGGFDQLVSRYTASLDAAMSLVPKGWECFDVDATAPELGVDWTLHRGKESVKGTAADAALSLCAAALKARGL